MARKVPADAFALYVLMQEGRSYQALADQLGFSKQAIQDCADRENWQERLTEINALVRIEVEKKLVETLAERRDQHLKLARAMQARGAKGLSDHEAVSCGEAIKAVESGVKLERLILGEANERTAFSVEAVTRAELDRYLARTDEPELREDGSTDW
jgi:hypothetical protein